MATNNSNNPPPPSYATCWNDIYGTSSTALGGFSSNNHHLAYTDDSPLSHHHPNLAASQQHAAVVVEVDRLQGHHPHIMNGSKPTTAAAAFVYGTGEFPIHQQQPRRNDAGNMWNVAAPVYSNSSYGSNITMQQQYGVEPSLAGHTTVQQNCTATHKTHRQFTSNGTSNNYLPSAKQSNLGATQYSNNVTPVTTSYDQMNQQYGSSASFYHPTTFGEAGNNFLSTTHQQAAAHHYPTSHAAAHTPPESVSPKSAVHNNSTNIVAANGAAFSPQSTTSNTSSSSSSTAVQQQPNIMRTATKRARQNDFVSTEAKQAKGASNYAASSSPANSSFGSSSSSNTSHNGGGASSSLPTAAYSRPAIADSEQLIHANIATQYTATLIADNNNRSLLLGADGNRNNIFDQPPPATASASSSVLDFDQFSTFGGDSGGCMNDLQAPNENPIKFQPHQPDMWAHLYDQHCQLLTFSLVSVEAEKGFNYSVYDQVHVCQKKNHFQMTCQFQTTGRPAYVGYCPLDMSRARIGDIHLHMYGIKLDAPDQKVRLQQSKPDRSKQDFQPLLVQGLGDDSIQQQQQHDMAIGQCSSNNNGVKMTIGRLHFADTTMNNMRKKGKPNRSQQYFALIVELSARDVEGRTYPIMSMISEKCIVRASNPGQFESNLDVTWLKSPNTGSESIFHKGKVGINVEKPSEALEVRGNIKLVGGHILNPSDERLKTDILPLDPKQQLENVTKMKVYKYRYKDGITQALGLQDEHGEFHEIGFLAQEVAAIIPDAVEISGDVTLINGEKIENLMVVNKDRIFVDTVAAVGQLSRVLDEIRDRIERVERERPKNRRGSSSLCRSDSLRSITSSVTQISNRLRMLVPASSTASDDLSSYYGYINNNNNSARRIDTPLNEAEEDDDEHVVVTTKQHNIKDGDDCTLSTTIDGQQHHQGAPTATTTNRLSLTNSHMTLCSTATTARTAISDDTSLNFDSTTWQSKEFDKCHSMALPTRKKSLVSNNNNTNSISDGDDEKYYNKKRCWIGLSRRCLLFVFVLLCIGIFSGLIPVIILFNNNARHFDSVADTTNAALVFPPSSSVFDEQALMEQYKMLPQMLTRQQTIAQCIVAANKKQQQSSKSLAADETAATCSKQYERHHVAAQMCCALPDAMPASLSENSNAGDIGQQQFLIQTLFNRARIHQQRLNNKLSTTTRDNENADMMRGAAVGGSFIYRVQQQSTMSSAAPPHVSQHYQRSTTRATSSSSHEAPAQMPTRDSPRIIVEAPPSNKQRILRRREAAIEKEVDKNKPQPSFGNNFSLCIPSLNVTLDRTFCQTDVDAANNNKCTTTCKIQVPLQSNFPLATVEIELATGEIGLTGEQHALDLCEFDYPVACNEEERILHADSATTRKNSGNISHSWRLPVGFYVTSSYRFLIARGEFTSSLGGVCSLLQQQNQSSSSCVVDKLNYAKFVIDVEFKRVCI